MARCAASRWGGDLDGDAVPDLLVSTWEGAAVVSGATRGEVTTYAATLYADAPAYAHAGVGDLDGDGAADLVVNTGAGSAWLLPGPLAGPVDAADGLPVPVPSDAGSPFQIAAAGDIDGDGYGEFVANCRGTTAAVGVYGVGGAKAEIPIYTGLSLDPRPAADVDGDGVTDLTFVAYDETSAAAWLVHGPLAGTVDLATDGVPFRGDTVASGLDDADGDGTPDLLIGLATGYSVDGGWWGSSLAVVLQGG